MTKLPGEPLPRLTRLLRLGGAIVMLGGSPPAWAAEPPQSCSRTSVQADVHTCVHGLGGPSATRVGLPYPHSGSPLEIQNVDPAHTIYTVLLSEPSESDQWVVSYASNTSGTFGFYLDLPGGEVFDEPPYPFELRDVWGDEVPVRLEHVVTRCPGYLSWVKVYELSSARYHLVLGGEANDNVRVAIEHLEAFPQDLFVDADGDGFGRSGAALSSWCGEASGYSLLGTDCDDGDASIIPDEEGVCDPCQGESCTSGSGGAASGPMGGGGLGGVSGAAGGGSQAGSSDPGGAAGAGAGGDPSGDGGSEASDGSAAGSGDGDSDGGGAPKDDSGCSCRVGANPSSRSGTMSALLVFGSWLLRRRASAKWVRASRSVREFALPERAAR